MLHRLTCLAAMAILFCAPPGFAQSNPVFVDDSPLAREMFARAMDLAETNPGEAARLLQELLDDYADRLIPIADDTPSMQPEVRDDRYVAVRTRVVEVLRARPLLLQRHRQTETPRAQRLLERGELARVADTRPLTQPGLEAMLILAQQHLESGRFNMALQRLHEATGHPHPDLDASHAAHAWYMMALASLYADRQERANRALEELERLAREGFDVAPFTDRLATFDRRGLLAGESSWTVFDRTKSVGLDELIAEEIWSVELDDSLYKRRERNTAADRPMMSRALQQARDEGHFLTIAPTVRGNVVYVNQGHRVSAYDRLSGTKVWEEDFVDRPPAAVIDRDDQQPRDLNVIAVQGNALVTLTGHAYSTGRSSDGRLIRLNAETGELQWSASLRTLANDDEELEDLFPHSSPVIVDDSVLILARKVTRQSLTSTYLVSYDLATGDVRWVRHIVSSGSIRRSPRAFSTIVVRDGAAFVSSSVGAVARVDAVSGRVDWLHRFPVEINPTPIELNQRPWELLSPVVLNGRVFALEPGYQRVAALDADTGRLVDSFDAQHEAEDQPGHGAFGVPAYLVGGSRYLISVGRVVRAIDPDQPSRPVWTLRVTGDGHDSPRAGNAAQRGAMPIHDADPFGRVVSIVDSGGPGTQAGQAGNGGQVVVEGDDSRGPFDEAMLIVPVRGGVVIVEEETGNIRLILPLGAFGGNGERDAEIHADAGIAPPERAIPQAGNVLAHEAQLLVAGSDRLRSYMSLGRAEQLLRERIAQQTDKPDAAIALVRLGARIDHFELVMEAAELAKHRLGEQEAANAQRAELVDLLLRYAADSRQPTAQTEPRPSGSGESRERSAPVQSRHELEGREPNADSRASELFAMIDGLVRTPEQRLRAALARGDWERDAGNPETALASYQSVLARDDVAQAEWAGGEALSVVRAGRSIAMGRIAALIEEFGEQVYLPQQQRAEAMLSALGNQPPGESHAEQSSAIARQFPFSRAATDAALQAAAQYEQRGEINRALDTLLEAYRVAHRTQVTRTTSSLLDRYIELCLAHGRREQALDAHQVRAEMADLTPHTGGQPRHGEETVVAGRRAEIGPLRGTGRVLDGAMLPAIPATSTRAQEWGQFAEAADSVLLRTGDDLRLVQLTVTDRGAISPDDGGVEGGEAGSLQPWKTVWTLGLKDLPGGGGSPARVSELVQLAGLRNRPSAIDRQIAAESRAPQPNRVRQEAASRESGPLPPGRSSDVESRALLLIETRPDDGSDDAAGARQRVVSVGMSTGNVEFAIPAVAGDRGEDAAILRMAGDYLVAVSPEGAATCYALDSGRRKWTVTRSGLDVIEHVAIQDGMVVLAGYVAGGASGGSGADTRGTVRHTGDGSSMMRVRPAMRVLDLYTGESRSHVFTPRFAGGGLIWVEPMPLGLLAYGSSEGVTMIDARTGELVWANIGYAVTETPRGWRMGLKLIAEDRDGNLRRIDEQSGQMSAAFQRPEHGDWEPLRLVELYRDGDAGVAHFRQRLVRYDMDGNVLGADVILNEAKHQWVLRGEDRIILISEAPARPAGEFGDPIRPFSQTEGERGQLYRVYALSPDLRLLEGEFELPAGIDPIERAALRDGWLLMSTAEKTIALPMPSHRAGGRLNN